jgi:curved DNA-binding protein CbpA
MDVTRAHATLGVASGASWEEVRRAYRQRLREHHPDTGRGDPEALGAVQDAYRRIATTAPRTIAPGTYGYGRVVHAPRLVDVYA